MCSFQIVSLKYCKCSIQTEWQIAIIEILRQKVNRIARFRNKISKIESPGISRTIKINTKFTLYHK